MNCKHHCERLRLAEESNVELETEVQEKKSLIEKLHLDLKETNNAVRKTEGIKEALEAEISARTEQVHLLEAEIIGYEEEIHRHLEETAQFQNDQHAISPTVAVLHTKLDAAVNDLAESQTALEKEMLTLDEMRQQSMLQAQKMKQLEKEHAEIEIAFTKENARVVELQDALQVALDKLEAASTENSELTHVRDLFEAAQKNISTLQNEMGALRQTLANCQAELDGVLTENAVLAEFNVQLKSTVSDLHAELNKKVAFAPSSSFPTPTPSKITGNDSAIKFTPTAAKLSVALTPGSVKTPRVPPANRVEAAAIVNQSKFFKYMKHEETSFVIIVDKSASMKLSGRWKQAEETVKTIAELCCKSTPQEEGITLYFFSSHSKTSKGECTAFQRYQRVDSAEQVMRLFSAKENKPHGGTDLTSVLEDAFALPSPHRKAILCITDGCPDDPESAEMLIVDKANSLDRGDETSITMIQVGDDERANIYLDELDHKLTQHGAKFDIVDCISNKNLASISLNHIVREAAISP